ncbi:N-acetyltransferase [Zobellella endophytica]|uniref:N-acetyltransferase n=1 Tax=Zobellella endophytica TaxID=2116700 RepID=A0A2P7RBN4_9GAMM|nr:GNAT family N-acetyltransferase [Zobellella endophytica]PSJ47646.1 N-acetyltransferase [Zobellella endophytica]
MTSRYRIELARPEHLALLPAIERAAATLFPDSVIPLALRDGVVSPARLAEALAERRLWVALSPRGEPVGFTLAEPGTNDAFLVELDVHPDHQRRGLGRRLIEVAIDWARARGHRRLTLTTFGSLPWNAPFYARLGFQLLDDTGLDPRLARQLAGERRLGLRDRVAMALALPPAVLPPSCHSFK